jgi:hypothetical protein
MDTPAGQASSAPIDLLGAWTLASLQLRQDDGTVSYPRGEQLRGLLTYTDTGYVSALLIPPDRPRFASGDQEQGTTEEIVAAFGSCTAYYGRYELDVAGGKVTHYVEASLYPNYEDQALVRSFRLEGDRLELNTAPFRWGGSERVFTLVWERVKT